MTINSITSYLEKHAPLLYQEPYDNARLITGDASWECSGVLTCLDSTEDVIDEAIKLDCNLVIAHHPIVFAGLKSLNGSNYIERVIIKAIKHDIAIYAIHTNLDNVINGVNHKIAEKLGLINLNILAPKRGLLRKLFTYIPVDHTQDVLEALFLAGAGQIGEYSECSFSHEGTGTFKGGDDTNPFVGKRGERHSEKEMKAEVVFPAHKTGDVLSALKNAHPYEEVAFEVIALENTFQEVGSGLIGDLAAPVDTLEFLKTIKNTMSTSCIRHTEILHPKIARVAICGGAGSFLLNDAIRAGADLFISADFKYHQFFDADSRIVIADIGHYESEQYTSELIYDILSQKFGNFAVHLTKVNTNPINYL